MKKFFRAFVAVAMVVAMFSGCATTTPSTTTDAPAAATQAPVADATATPQPQTVATATPVPVVESNLAESQVLDFAMTVDAPSLDQNKASSAASSTVARGIYEGLIRVEAGYIVNPGMAEEWEISEDGKTYTFHLRDAQWSNGTEVTAHDFVYGFKRLLNPDTASSYAFLGYIVKNGLDVNSGTQPLDNLGITATDEKTLVIEIEYPAPYFLAMLNMMQLYPVNQEFVEAQATSYGQETSNLIYNGPFILKEWKHEQYLLLEKNPNYWDAESVVLEEVKIHVIPAGTTVSIDKYNAGELDFVDIPTAVWEEYQNSPDVLYVNYGAVDWLSIKMDDPENPWLANKNFRLALNYAVDREDYVLLATKGIQLPGTRLVLPDVMGFEKPYFEEYDIQSYPTKADPVKAQEYLALAMAELGITDPKEITVTLINSDDNNSKLACEVLQDQIITNLGITFEIQPVTYAQKLENDHKSTYELVFKGWMPDYDDPMTYMELFQTGNGEATCHWNNAEYDALIEKARYESDPKTRMDFFAEAEQLMIDEAAFVPLQVRQRPWLCNEKLMGLSRSFMVSEDYVYAYFVK